MTPPKLPRNAPVSRIREPIIPDFGLKGRQNLEFSVGDDLHGVGGHPVAVDEPLLLQHRLDHVAGTRAKRQCHGVIAGAAEEAERR